VKQKRGQAIFFAPLPSYGDFPSFHRLFITLIQKSACARYFCRNDDENISSHALIDEVVKTKNPPLRR
jgi:hypothetical protein